jgi:Family of unknown function (DUF6402)
MSPIYRPGWESKTYRKYPRDVRAAIAANVDKLFRQKTGVTRPLDPTSRSDRDLRGTWLRLRDEIVGAKEQEILEEDRRDSLLPAIPYEMEWEHWTEGAKLLETWFERPPSIAPKYSKPVTDLIKMDWVLKFPRAKSVFDQILADKIWTNDASRKRLAELLRNKPPVAGSTFGDLTLRSRKSTRRGSTPARSVPGQQSMASLPRWGAFCCKSPLPARCFQPRGSRKSSSTRSAYT